MFVLFFTPFIITVSKLLFSGEPPIFRNVLKSVLNPAFVSVIISILVVYTKLYRIIPDFFIDISYKIGNVTIPLILFTLGGSLYYAYKTNTNPASLYTLSAVFIKLVLLPLLVFFVLLFVKAPTYMKIVFIL